MHDDDLRSVTIDEPNNSLRIALASAEGGVNIELAFNPSIHVSVSRSKGR